MPYRYVPQLRTKAGESTALSNLTTAAKDRILPLFHLIADPPATFVPTLAQGWSGRLAALDAGWNFAQTGSVADFNSMLAGVRSSGVPAMPSVAVGAHPTYLSAVQNAYATAPHLGIVVRTSLGDIAHLSTWIAQLGVTASQIDLVISAGHVPDIGQGVLGPVVAHHLGAIPMAGWRSVTLAASAAPQDFGALAYGLNTVPRMDWALWQNARLTAPAQLDYGDFGVAHPNLAGPPGFAMANATVSARYTLDNDWLMIKGRSTRGMNGLPMGQQYRGHAATIVSTAGTGGLVSCWGDQEIQRISGSPLRPGGRPQWAGYSTSRHLSLVADRLP